MLSNQIVATKRDNGLSFARVVSMFLIIVTHIIAQIGPIASLSLVTNSAIYTFLLISGLLYGKKTITNPGVWYIKRMKKILIPVYLYLIFIFGYLATVGEFTGKIFFVHLFNLQGFLGGVQGTGHLWFISTIMLCYLVTPLLEKGRGYINESNKGMKILLVSAVVFFWIIVSLSSNQVIGNNVGYLIFYSFSYYISSFWDRKLTLKAFMLLTIITVIMFAVRLIARNFIDDTNLYDVIIVTICQSFSGVYLFILLDKAKWFYNNVYLLKVINYFDKITFEMYIVHHCFIIGPFFVWGASGNILLDSLLVLLATYICGVALNKTSNYLLSYSWFASTGH